MDYPTNIYALAAIVILALSGGLGGYIVQRRNNKRNGFSEDRVRWLIAEHERGCLRVNELRDEVRALRDEMAVGFARLNERLDRVIEGRRSGTPA